MLEVTSDNYEEEVTNSDKPVLIEFWASWCAPCKMMEPMMVKLSDQYKQRMKFVKINIDRNADISDIFKIHGVPAFTCVVNGNKQGKVLIGAQTDSKLREFIQEEITSSSF